MDLQAEYQAKLMTAETAVQLTPKRGNFSMGMAVSEPSLLLQALEKNVAKKVGYV